LFLAHSLCNPCKNWQYKNEIKEVAICRELDEDLLISNITYKENIFAYKIDKSSE
jgi:hypothetical protein